VQCWRWFFWTRIYTRITTRERYSYSAESGWQRGVQRPRRMALRQR